MPDLIYDLLMTEAWKSKVYPIIKQEVSETSTIRSYMSVSVLGQFDLKYCLPFSNNLVQLNEELFHFRCTMKLLW